MGWGVRERDRGAEGELQRGCERRHREGEPHLPAEEGSYARINDFFITELWARE